MVVENIGDVLRRFDVLIVDLHYQISADVNRCVSEVCAFTTPSHSGFIRCTAGNYLLDQHTCISSQTHLIRKLRPDGKQSGDSQTGTTNTPKLHQIIQNGFRGVDGNCEAHSCALLNTSGEDHAVDANHLSMGVQQWSARVSRIDGGVGLNRLIDRSSFRPTYGANRTDDAARHRPAEPEGISYGVNLLSDFKALGVSQ